MPKSTGSDHLRTSRFDIGDRVRKLRKWLRISQTAVGEYLNIPRSSVSALEGGKRDLGAQELLHLSRLFRCDPNSILGLTNTTPVDRPNNPTSIFNTRTNTPNKDLDEHDRNEIDNFTGFLKGRLVEQSIRRQLPNELVRSAVPQIAAEELRAKLKVTYPVDIYSIIQSIGLYPRFTALINLAGAIVRTSADDKSAVFGILINSDQPEERTRYSAAHEVGHYILGHLPNSEDVHPSLKSRWKNPIESDADSFAAELLMPKEAIAEYAKGRPMSARQAMEIADALLVSYQAILYRLLDLNLISKVEHERFTQEKPSELRDQLSETKKKPKQHKFDVTHIKPLIDQINGSLSREFVNSPDGIRFVQEAACFEYWKATPFSSRATEVKDVYEDVALWMVRHAPPTLA